jgi:hypothetical protein
MNQHAEENAKRLERKYAVFPPGNDLPTALDKRLTALLREVEAIRLELQTAEPGNTELSMHMNLPAEISNLGVVCDWLLRDYRNYWAKAPFTVTPDDRA